MASALAQLISAKAASCSSLSFPRRASSRQARKVATSKPTVGLLVATFLACLELARLGKLKLEQDAAFAEINCTKAEAGAGPNAGEAADGTSEFDAPAVPTE